MWQERWYFIKLPQADGDPLTNHSQPWFLRPCKEGNDTFPGLTEVMMYGTALTHRLKQKKQPFLLSNNKLIIFHFYMLT